METISLKALARKVLQRNKQGNSMETAQQEDGNLTETKFEQRFNQLADKLQSYTLTDDEIRLHMPGLHKDIQAAIERMDTAWLRFDYEGFLLACKQIEQFYFNALREHERGGGGKW